MPALTKPEDIAALKQWGNELKSRLDPKQYEGAYLAFASTLQKVWEGTVQLVEQFPNEHTYDDVKRGTNLCIDVMDKARAAGLDSEHSS